MNLSIPEPARAALAAILDAIDAEDRLAAAHTAEAEKALAAAARFRADARHSELEPMAPVVAPTAERVAALIDGAAPAPLDHRERARMHKANEERAAVRRQLVVDADALEERAGLAHAKAEQHRARAAQLKAKFIWQATETMQASLKDAMCQLVLGPMLALAALKAEAPRAGVQAPGSISLALDYIRLGILDPARGMRELWPLRSELIVTGERFDPAAGYAQLIKAIREQPTPGADA